MNTHAIKISREEYTLLHHSVPSRFSIGAVHYGADSGQPELEYIFTNEITEAEEVRLRRVVNLYWEEQLRMPCIPAFEAHQIAELERLLLL